MSIIVKQTSFMLVYLLAVISGFSQQDNVIRDSTAVVPASLEAPSSLDSFYLSGTAPAPLNGNMIYIGTLDYSGQHQAFMDSTRIEHGHFLFSGHLPQTTMLTTIHIRRPQLAIAQFYLENRAITITIHPTPKRNLFDNITYINSPITTQYLALQKANQENNNRSARQAQLMDSLWQKAPDSCRKKMDSQYREIQNEIRNKTIDFIRDNPDNYFSLYQLCYFVTGSTIGDPDQLLQLLSYLSPALQQKPEAQRLLQRIQQVKAVTAGKPAPWKVIPTDQNEPFDISRWKGQYIILDFWASWCGPCLQNLPALKEVYSNFHPKGVEVVGISLDDHKEAWTSAIKKHDLTWPQVSDLQGWKNAVAQLYDIRAIPQYVLIAKDGKIMQTSTDMTTIRKTLNELTNQQTTP